MMEKLGEPQTHLGLKAMIKEVDEDNDGQISFREVSVSMVGRGSEVSMSSLQLVNWPLIASPQKLDA